MHGVNVVTRRVAPPQRPGDGGHVVSEMERVHGSHRLHLYSIYSFVYRYSGKLAHGRVASQMCAQGTRRTFTGCGTCAEVREIRLQPHLQLIWDHLFYVWAAQGE